MIYKKEWGDHNCYALQNTLKGVGEPGTKESAEENTHMP
jgi:hypothetical protein